MVAHHHTEKLFGEALKEEEPRGARPAGRGDGVWGTSWSKVMQKKEKKIRCKSPEDRQHASGRETFKGLAWMGVKGKGSQRKWRRRKQLPM